MLTLEGRDSLAHREVPEFLFPGIPEAPPCVVAHRVTRARAYARSATQGEPLVQHYLSNTWFLQNWRIL